MKYICNAMQEGRCKGEPRKCIHSVPHYLFSMSTVDFCTEKRFCEVQNETVRCVEAVLFPNMKNPIMIPQDLAREFVEWVKQGQFCNVSDETLCNRLAICLLEQLK